MTPLNEEALEAMSRVMNPNVWHTIDRFPDDELVVMTKQEELSKAKKLAEAYLSAVPADTVNSVAELDALKDGAIIIDDDGDVMRYTSKTDSGNHWEVMGTEEWYSSAALPATVLYRPEMKP